MTVIQNEKVILDEKEVAAVFSKYFDAPVTNVILKVPENLLFPHKNIVYTVFPIVQILKLCGQNTGIKIFLF